MRYELDYSHAPAIGRQSFQATVTPQVFAEQISSARSFLLLEEAEWLRSQGLGTHVTHDEILVFDDHGPLENELRFPDECVRHKLLDLIGDLGLCGHRVTGQFTACRSGHQLNAALAHELVLTTQPAVHGRTA
jgi:UDP-3-O-acyl-N-acetylglucosamine deacetylase